VLQHGPRAAADQGCGAVHRRRRQAARDQHPVQRPHQIDVGLHQRSIQVEGDGPAFQIALRHPSLPPSALMG
jgi:hypothetical protein